jgi:hypothetical protein
MYFEYEFFGVDTSWMLLDAVSFTAAENFSHGG